MAGEQRDHVPIPLDQDRLDIIRIDDLDLRDLIGERLPEICYVNLVAELQQLDIQKIFVSVPGAVPGNNGVCAAAADGDAGLRQDRRAVGHVFIAGTQVQRHLQFHLRNFDNAENLVLEPVGCQIEA